MLTNRTVIGCLLALISAQTCLAGTVEKFGTTHIYGTVDSEGIPIFTDIPPVDEPIPLPAVQPAQQGKPPRPFSRNDTAGRPTAPSLSEMQADRIAEAIPPEMRDGGLPPEDH